jgi:hypothetical protein
MARRALICCGLGLVLLLGNASSATSQGDPLTLVVTPYENVNATGLAHRFTGVATGAAAGELVDVLGRDCGSKPNDFRLIAQTQTRAGGGYQADNPEQVFPFRRVEVGSGMELKARWNGIFSNSYTWRTHAPFYVIKMGKRRAWKAHLMPPWGVQLSLKGKIAELQRQVGTRWVRYARAKFVHKPSFLHGSTNYEAVFNVPKRGLKLRAVLSAPNAAPCYLTTITPPWRS